MDIFFYAVFVLGVVVLGLGFISVLAWAAFKFNPFRNQVEDAQANKNLGLGRAIYLGGCAVSVGIHAMGSIAAGENLATMLIAHGPAQSLGDLTFTTFAAMVGLVLLFALAFTVIAGVWSFAVNIFDDQVEAGEGNLAMTEARGVYLAGCAIACSLVTYSILVRGSDWVEKALLWWPH